MIKQDAVASLGEQRLLRPARLREALKANDRLKLVLTLLQAGATHAQVPQEPVPDLAREIGTSQNKLKSVFRQAFGLTMADYCLERRMREAQQLLMEAALTIAQVAERVGYEHQSSFAAAFSGHVGMSPREYRKHRAPFSLDLPTGSR